MKILELEEFLALEGKVVYQVLSDRGSSELMVRQGEIEFSKNPSGTIRQWKAKALSCDLRVSSISFSFSSLYNVEFTSEFQYFSNYYEYEKNTETLYYDDDEAVKKPSNDLERYLVYDKTDIKYFVNALLGKETELLESSASTIVVDAPIGFDPIRASQIK